MNPLQQRTLQLKDCKGYLLGMSVDVKEKKTSSIIPAFISHHNDELILSNTNHNHQFSQIPCLNYLLAYSITAYNSHSFKPYTFYILPCYLLQNIKANKQHHITVLFFFIFSQWMVAMLWYCLKRF